MYVPNLVRAGDTAFILINRLFALALVIHYFLTM